MSTVILTPLFPPDTSESARYTKLLAARLPSKNLTVVAYGSLPESVPDVEIITISKRSSRFLRLWRCLYTLLKLKPTSLIVQNGPSTELPALFYSYLRKVRLAYVVSDHAAATTTSPIAKKLRIRTNQIITLPTDSTTYLPTEWLPFTETSEPSTTNWWETHIAKILHD